MKIIALLLLAQVCSGQAFLQTNSLTPYSRDYSASLGFQHDRMKVGLTYQHTDFYDLPFYFPRNKINFEYSVCNSNRVRLDLVAKYYSHRRNPFFSFRVLFTIPRVQ